MNKIVVLFFSVVLFNCGGTDSTDDGADSADMIADGAGGDADSGIDVKTDEAADDIADCPLGCACCADYDCACLKWPQTVEYMWFVGTWECTEIDGVPDGTIVEVTVRAWDTSLGAEVWGFDPVGMIYAKKEINGTFTLFRDFGEDGTAAGTADKNVLAVEMDNCGMDNICSHYSFKKLK